MLQITNLELQQGSKLLLKNVTQRINENEKIGIVGVNGSGKSSLLKTIVGQIPSEEGVIKMDGEIAYLSQEVHIDNTHDSDPTLTVEDYLALTVERVVESWEIAKLMNLMNLDGKDPWSLISEMSGGQKVKVEIIKLLLSSSDLLILDEPTNFLDIPTAEWLMSYLVKYQGAVLIVSHDLRLMNKAINQIWFLNEFTKSIDVFPGNYNEFMEKKAAQDEALAHKLKLQEREAIKLMDKAQKKRNEGQRKGDIAQRMEAKAQALKQQTREESVALKKSAKMNLRFDTKVFPGRKVLETDGLSKAFGKLQVLKSVSFEVLRGETHVIIGKNGVGKSTLLKILTGNIEADSGSFNWGHNVDFGYYAQEYEGLDYNDTLFNNLKNDTRLDELYEEDIRKILGTFLFSGDKAFQDVGSLSGGEKTRLALAKLFAGGYNTLILDEPTTYLDPQSQTILLDALKSYEGTLLIVSHVPDFVNALKPDYVYLMPEEKTRYFEEKYLDRVGIE